MRWDSIAPGLRTHRAARTRNLDEAPRGLKAGGHLVTPMLIRGPSPGPPAWRSAPPLGPEAHRLKAGYLVPVDITTTTETVFITGGSAPTTGNTYFQTQFINGELAADGGTFTRSTSYFTDLFPTTGDVLYSELPGYQPTGFYVYTKDFEGDNFRKNGKSMHL